MPAMTRCIPPIVEDGRDNFLLGLGETSTSRLGPLCPSPVHGGEERWLGRPGIAHAGSRPVAESLPGVAALLLMTAICQKTVLFSLKKKNLNNIVVVSLYCFFP